MDFILTESMTTPTSSQMQCVQCTGVLLEEVKMKCFSTGVGYYCRSCKHIYDITEYRRLRKSLGLDEVEVPLPINEDAVIRIGQGQTMIKLSEDIAQLLSIENTGEEKLKFSSDIEER